MSPRLITASSDMAIVRSECHMSLLRRSFDSTGLYVDSTVLGLYRRCSGLKRSGYDVSVILGVKQLLDGFH